jgi:hypothetical protein
MLSNLSHDRSVSFSHNIDGEVWRRPGPCWPLFLVWVGWHASALVAHIILATRVPRCCACGRGPTLSSSPNIWNPPPAVREPGSASIDATLPADELGEGLGLRFVPCSVPHDPAPLAAGSLVGLRRVGGATNNSGKGAFPIRDVQPLQTQCSASPIDLPGMANLTRAVLRNCSMPAPSSWATCAAQLSCRTYLQTAFPSWDLRPYLTSIE